jgi:hypothetical protein
MKRILLTLLTLAWTSFLKSSGTTQAQSLQTKMSLYYLKGIKTTRLLFMSLLGVGICLILLWTGLVVVHVSLFLTSWEPQTKLLVNMIFGLIYITVAVGTFSFVFSETLWLKMFHMDKIMEELKKKKAQSSEIEKEFRKGGDSSRHKEKQYMHN